MNAFIKQLSASFAVSGMLVLGVVSAGTLVAPAYAQTDDPTVTSDTEVTDAQANQALEDECNKAENKDNFICASYHKQTDGLLQKLGAPVFIILSLLYFAAFVFSVIMFIHAARHPVANKALWLLLIFFTGLIGALIYFFTERKKVANGGVSTAEPLTNGLPPQQTGTMPQAGPTTAPPASVPPQQPNVTPPSQDPNNPSPPQQ
jgi:hypothetical protein